MSTVTVTIGRNVGAEPMSDERWTAFRNYVHGLLEQDHWGTVHVRAARSVGQWEGISEESSTYVAGDIPADDIPELLAECARLARVFDQDAIAVTVGETHLVGAA